MGQPVLLASNIADTSGLSFRWDFGDGSSSITPTSTKTYNTPGTYSLSLTVTGSDGSSRTESSSLLVGRFSLLKDLRCTGAQANSGWCREATLPLVGGTPIFLDSNNGWVIGQVGDFDGNRAVYRTTDGGRTWSGHQTGAPNWFSSLAFANPSNGLGLAQVADATGTYHTEVWGSNDGGQTWARRAVLATAYSSPLFVSNDGARVVLRSSTGGLASFDAGATWTATAFGSPSITPSGTLWQISGTQVLRSTDLGASSTSTTLAEGGPLETIVLPTTATAGSWRATAWASAASGAPPMVA